jgi:hypothetical protein
MPKTTKSLTFDVFLTPEGKNTCCLSPVEECQFLGTSNYGQRFICLFNNEEVRRGDSDQYGAGMGYLIPCKKCPFRENK